MKLNGWQRAWVFFGYIYLALLIFFVISNWPSNTENKDVILKNWYQAVFDSASSLPYFKNITAEEYQFKNNPLSYPQLTKQIKAIIDQASNAKEESLKKQHPQEGYIPLI